MANDKCRILYIFLVSSSLFFTAFATNLVRKDLGPSPKDHTLEVDLAAEVRQVTTASSKDHTSGLAVPADAHQNLIQKTAVASKLPGDMKLNDGAAQASLSHYIPSAGDKFLSVSMMWRAWILALSVTVSVIVFLYWSKGAFVILKVLIYLLALSSMKGAVKTVEHGNYFKFPLFVTGTHLAGSAILAFVLLLREHVSTGVGMTMPSASDFTTRFGLIAVGSAASISMNNIALLHSTTAFVEIVGASAPIVTVLTIIVMKQPFDMRLLAPCLVVFIGCALTSNGEPNFSTLGLVLAAGSNLPRALKTVLQQLLLQEDSNSTAYSPIEVLAWTCLPSSVIMLTWSFFQEGMQPYHRLHDQGFMSQLMGALLLSIVNACILNTATLFVVKDLGAVGTQLVAQTKSMLVVLSGMCVLHEQVSRQEFLGFILVMVGVYAYNDLEARLKARRAAENLAFAEKMAVMGDGKQGQAS